MWAAVTAVEASAQSASSADVAAAANETADIVITGSRIIRRDYSATSPIVTVQSEALDYSGSVALESALTKLPQFGAGLNAYNSNFTATGQATLNLRGLGASRNLVLLDGRRMQPSSSSVEIDINTIPSALIGSVEVISGGASAVYGSDAISGVVNFKLKRDMNGIGFNSQVSQTERGDGRQATVSLAVGSDLANDRGNVMFGLEYFDREPFYSRDRPFYEESFLVGGGLASAVIPIGLYVPTATNRPSQAAIDTVFGAYGIAPGTPRNALFGTNADGTLFTQNFGVRNYRGALGSNGLGINGAGALVYDPGIIQALQSPMTRYAGFGRMDYDLTPNISLYAQTLYTSYTNISNGAGGNAQGALALSVPVTNPFMPADLAYLAASRTNPNEPLTLNKRISFMGERTIEHDVSLFQFLTGATGTINKFGGLVWDVYASHGETDITDTVTNGGIYRADIQRLLEATDGGVSLCAGGLDVFGDTRISAECHRFLSKQLTNSTSLVQDNVEANIQGKVFDLPAGEVRLAVGGSFRKNSYQFRPDAALDGDTTDVVGFQVAVRTAGETEVYEAYGEVLVPLLKDQPLVEELSLDMAYRRSSYTDLGDFNTYMANLNWSVVPSVRLRGGYQRAIRAPNVGELYSGVTSSSANYGSVANGGGDPCDIRTRFRTTDPNAAKVRDLCLAQGISSAAIDTYTTDFNTAIGLTGGNPNLTAETADTYTAGVVWRPEFSMPLFDNISVSLDYYSIEIATAIGIVAGPTQLYKCFNSDGSNPTYSPTSEYCQAVERNPGVGTINTIDSSYLNLGGYKTSGLDFQFDWRIDASDVGLSDKFGNLTINFLANYLNAFKIQNLDTDPFRDYTNTIDRFGSYPEYRSTTTATYRVGPASVGARWLYIGGMDDLSRVTNPTNVLAGVDSYNMVDLFGSWTINDHFTIRSGIDNVADADPIAIAGVPGRTDTSLYDPAGRRYYLAFTAKY